MQNYKSPKQNFFPFIIFSSTKYAIISEYNLVCSNDWMNSALTSISFAGFLGGACMGGYMSDKYGRQKSFTGFFFLSILQIRFRIFTKVFFELGSKGPI